jgi:uncharacterized protein (DUF362 family)
MPQGRFLRSSPQEEVAEMRYECNRRGFLKYAAGLAGVMAAKGIYPFKGTLAHAKETDVVVVKGGDPPGMVRRVLDVLGGMKRFVKSGDDVVILPNPQGGRPGVSTDGRMVAETIELCYQAGAAKVTVASIHKPERWFAAGIIQEVERAGAKVHFPSSDQDWDEVRVVRGKILKKARILRKARENDVLINMPIVKQHDSTRITCTLKNLMGFNANNRAFHQGAAHLHQCIVDLATLFKPNLLIVDANRVLTENGPFGPGKVISPQKVIAGTDMVAVDAFCCGLLSIEPQEVPHIIGSHNIGMGNIDLSGLRVREVEL